MRVDHQNWKANATFPYKILYLHVIIVMLCNLCHFYSRKHIKNKPYKLHTQGGFLNQRIFDYLERKERWQKSKFFRSFFFLFSFYL